MEIFVLPYESSAKEIAPCSSVLSKVDDGKNKRNISLFPPLSYLPFFPLLNFFPSFGVISRLLGVVKSKCIPYEWVIWREVLTGFHKSGDILIFI